MNAVAKTREQLPANAEMDDFLLADQSAGSENVTKEDILVPFIRIVQSMSKERIKAEEKYIEKAEEGDFFNTVTRQLWKAGEGLYMVPISYARNYTEWEKGDEKEDGKFIRDHGNDTSTWDKTFENDDGDKETADGTIMSESGNMYVFVVDPKTGAFEPAVVSFSGTQWKKVRQWVSRLTQMRVAVKGQSINPPFFYGVWTVSSIAERNTKGNWFGWKLDFLQPVSEIPMGREVYMAARSFGEQVKSGEVKAAAPDVDAAPSKRSTDGQGQTGTGGGGSSHPDDEIPF